MTPHVVLMNTEEMLALPENGMGRDLIRGELTERPSAFADRFHARAQASLTASLMAWQWTQPRPWGMAYSGPVGCVLRRDPDTTVGIDIAYLSPAMEARQPDKDAYIEGPPLLAIEIPSGPDTQGAIDDKIDACLSAGVSLVWIVNVWRRTVTVYHPEAEAELFNVTQELTAEPHLPGLRTSVKSIFE